MKKEDKLPPLEEPTHEQLQEEWEARQGGFRDEGEPLDPITERDQLRKHLRDLIDDFSPEVFDEEGREGKDTYEMRVRKRLITEAKNFLERGVP